MDKIFKAFNVVSKAIDLEAGIFEAMISTETVDRQGDIVRAAGAKVENYLKNPVVLWAHHYDVPPVARALSLEIVPGVGIKSKFQFPEWGLSPLADTTRRLWAAGYLNATSIGFIPLVAEDIKGADDTWRPPQDYKEWELLEYSIVPVPANQDALRLAIKTLTEAPISKRGRVLSAANEARIKKAKDALEEVLNTLGDAPEEGDGKTEPQTDANVSNNAAPSNDANTAEEWDTEHIFEKLKELL